MLIYIENKDLLSLIVSYLDYKKVCYFTDVNSGFDILVIAQYSSKTLNLVKKAKKVIFISYLVEEKIYNNYLKCNELVSFINKCDVVISSLPFFKSLFSVKKFVFIPRKNLCVSKCKKNIFKSKKKVITIIDSDYKYLNIIDNIVSNNFGIAFNLIGFNCNLSYKNKKILDSLSNSINLIKYFNVNNFNELINDSFLIIFFDDILSSFDYLNICICMKKNIMLLDSDLYNNYFINNKNIYLFGDNYNKVLDKIISNRVSNLGDASYNLVVDNDIKHLSDKLCQVLK